MRVLLIGLGQIGLGLIAPIFQKAGYTVVGTDTNPDRLRELRAGYFIKTPKVLSGVTINCVETNEIGKDFDFVVTSVGRQNLGKVFDYLREEKICVPVLLAENLPDSVNLFSEQISPIVVDRICPRVERHNDLLTIVAEDYYKIVTLDGPLTHQLRTTDGTCLEEWESDVEFKRKQKMFTVNTVHVVTALYGLQLGHSLVEEAILNKDVSYQVCGVLVNVARWLGLDLRDSVLITEKIIKRFSSPIRDLLTRILNPEKKESALQYLEKPLREIKAQGRRAFALENAYQLLLSY